MDRVVGSKLWSLQLINRSDYIDCVLKALQEVNLWVSSPSDKLVNSSNW